MAKGKAVTSSPTKVFLIRSMIRIFSVLPVFVGRWIAYIFAKVSRWTKSRAYVTSKTNIELCLPELTKEQQQEIIHQSLINTGRLFTEAAKVWCRKDAEKWLDNIYGEEAVKATLESGKGVLITGAHLGNWEVALYYLAVAISFTACIALLANWKWMRSSVKAVARTKPPWLKATARAYFILLMHYNRLKLPQF